jgi:hypothetical protein
MRGSDRHLTYGTDIIADAFFRRTSRISALQVGHELTFADVCRSLPDCRGTDDCATCDGAGMVGDDDVEQGSASPRRLQAPLLSLRRWQH